MTEKEEEMEEEKAKKEVLWSRHGELTRWNSIRLKNGKTELKREDPKQKQTGKTDSKPASEILGRQHRLAAMLHQLLLQRLSMMLYSPTRKEKKRNGSRY